MSVTLPSNREAEVGLIGSCLDGGIESSLIAFDRVPPEAFAHEELAMAYRCLQKIVAGGRNPDTLLLLEEWKRLSVPFPLPSELYDAQDRHGKYTLDSRAELVWDCYQRRKAILAADALIGKAQRMDEPIQDSIAECESAIGENSHRAPPIVEPKVAAANLIGDLERRFNLNGKRSGIETGFHKWDDLTDGLQMGEFWVIGARPNVGKTSLALNVADTVCIRAGVPTLFVSLEMSAIALTRRLLSMHAEVNASSIRRGSFTEGEFKSMGAFQMKLAKSPLYILDSPGGIRVGQLCHSIRAAIRRWKIQVVLLDYLQKIRPDKKGEKRTYEIGDTTSQVVEMVKRENIHMTALAQLNRDPEKGGRPPVLSDLADSKSIEADADFVGLLDRPIEGNESRAQLIVAKQRDGERGVVDLDFQGWFCRFRSASPIGTMT